MSIMKDFYEKYHGKIEKIERENEAYKLSEQEANEIIAELKYENKRLQELTCPTCGEKYLSPTGAELYDKILNYKQALEEIKNEIGDLKDINRLINLQKILDKINEALNDN